MIGNAPIKLDIEQRTPEWLELHLGRPTGSQFHRVVTKKGNLATETAKTYKWQLLSERIFGVSFAPKIDMIPAVRHGVEYEGPAREDLIKRLGRPVERGGVVMSADKRLLVSPDGWVGDTPVEIKCPQLPGQLKNLIEDPRDHWPQLQGQIMLSQADWLFFWSWHPCTPPRLLQVQRDQTFCNQLNYELRQFCDDLERTEDDLRKLGEFNVELYREMMKPKEAADEVGDGTANGDRG